MCDMCDRVSIDDSIFQSRAKVLENWRSSVNLFSALEIIEPSLARIKKDLLKISSKLHSV